MLAARIILTIILLAVAIGIERSLTMTTWQELLVYLPAYLLIASGTLREAIEGILHGDVFNENLLMTIATLGALSIGFLPGAQTQFAEAVTVMLLYRIGTLCEHYAEGKSRHSISHLMNLRPDVAHVIREGKTLVVPVEEVAVGETLLVQPGERIPIDGIVTEGQSTLDTRREHAHGRESGREGHLGGCEPAGSAQDKGYTHLGGEHREPNHQTDGERRGTKVEK